MSEAGGSTPDQPTEAPSAFQVLCHSLAAQVHMALGLLADPVDGKVHVEIGAAKQGIDMLAMLEEKTQGNLDERESKTLGLYLTQVRMLFVERVKELQEGGGEAAEAAEGAAESPAASEDGDGPTIITP